MTKKIKFSRWRTWKFFKIKISKINLAYFWFEFGCSTIFHRKANLLSKHWYLFYEIPSMDCWDIKLFMNHGLQKVKNFWPPLKKFGGVKKIFFCIFVLSVYRTTYIPKIIQFRVGPVKSCVHLTWNAPDIPHKGKEKSFMKLLGSIIFIKILDIIIL